MTESLISLRAEARRLGVNPSTLSEAVHNGWRCADEDVGDRARFDVDTGHCVGFVPLDASADDWNDEDLAEHQHEDDDQTDNISDEKLETLVEARVMVAVEELLDDLVDEAVAFVAPETVRREVERQLVKPANESDAARGERSPEHSGDFGPENTSPVLVEELMTGVENGRRRRGSINQACQNLGRLMSGR